MKTTDCQAAIESARLDFLLAIDRLLNASDEAKRERDQLLALIDARSKREGGRADD